MNKQVFIAFGDNPEVNGFATVYAFEDADDAMEFVDMVQKNPVPNCACTRWVVLTETTHRTPKEVYDFHTSFCAE